MLPFAIDLALSILYLFVHSQASILQFFQSSPSSFFLSLTPSKNSLMALTIVKEPASNFLLLFSILLLALPCTPSNLQALDLGVSKPINGA